MARYIDADDFYKRLSDPPYTIYNGEMFAEWFDECFKTQPTADVEPVRHGRWIATNDENKKRCSECDIIHLIAQYPYGKANYCPNCGAKMDGDADA